MELADAIAFALLQAVLRWQPFVLGLHDCEGHRFGCRGDWSAKDIVSAAGCALARLVVYNVDWLRGFLDSNVGAAVPSSVLDGGVDELESGLSFGARHFLHPPPRLS